MNRFMLLYNLNLWLHFLSVLLWLGGIVFFLFVFAPAVHALPPGTGVHTLAQGARSLQTLSWIAIVLLVATGALNFISRGMAIEFRFGPGYYSILGLKLFLVLAMLFHHLLQAFKYAPRIASLTAQSAHDIPSWPEPLLSHWKKWFVLLKINVTLGLIVILLGLGLARS